MKKGLIMFVIIVLLALVSLFAYKIFLQKQNKSLETFQEQNSIQEEIVEEVLPKEDTHIKMSAIGDIMCHNSQYKDAYDSTTGIYDFSYVFEDVKEYVKTADIAIGNLETTFAGKQKGYSNYPRFNTPEQLAIDLKEFGIDVLSTANNHCMDTNFSGLVSTLKYLDEAGIDHTGTSATIEEQKEILVKDVNGIKIAFLSFTYGTNGIPVPTDKSFSVNLIDDKLILEQIELAKEHNPDLICVNMHWGIEYQTKQNTEQERLTNMLFQNGVDIILGSHPHVLQPMQKKQITLGDGTTKDCFVIYSLGNFMSGQTKVNTRNSVILNIDITKNGETGKITIDNIEYVPIYMYKSAGGTNQRYKVIDIKKAISNYEKGDDTIGQVTYNTLKNELVKIQNTMNFNNK